MNECMSITTYYMYIVVVGLVEGPLSPLESSTRNPREGCAAAAAAAAHSHRPKKVAARFRPERAG